MVFICFVCLFVAVVVFFFLGGGGRKHLSISTPFTNQKCSSFPETLSPLVTFVFLQGNRRSSFPFPVSNSIKCTLLTESVHFWKTSSNKSNRCGCTLVQVTGAKSREVTNHTGEFLVLFQWAWFTSLVLFRINLTSRNSPYFHKANLGAKMD